MTEDIKTLKQHISHLHFLMELSNAAFSKYLVNKFYLHALCIRKCNKAVYAYIIQNADAWPHPLQDSLIALLNHYDIWFTQFKDFRENKKFKLDEPFVFYHLDDQSAYPKVAAQKVIDLYHHLNNSAETL